MNRKILEATSKETGYNRDVVDFWCDKLWAFTNQMILDGEFEGLMLPYFGKFTVRHDRKKFYESIGVLSRSRKRAVGDCYRLPKLGFLDEPGGGKRVAKIEDVPEMPPQPRPSKRRNVNAV